MPRRMPGPGSVHDTAALVVEHRQQTARLSKVEQLVRDVIRVLDLREGTDCPVEDCDYCALYQRARDLGLVE